MRSNLTDIQWCPGCGNFLIQWALKAALKELWIEKHNVVVVSWIGCSGKHSQYIDCYWAETLHGRTLPFATWVKLSNPNLTVIAIWWDWDGYWIGMWHFVHACRKDIDITYIVANNEIYWLTTGQASPTTPLGQKTNSTPAWNAYNPFNPNELAKISGCNFSEKAKDKDFLGLKEILKKAISHKWFAHVDIDQACPTWRRW